MSNVLITGCSSGFGLLTAIQFAKNGDKVFATVRNPDKADALKAAIQKDNLSIEIVKLDVCDDASVVAAVKQAEAKAPIDVLVNNAGIEVRGPVEEVSDEEVILQMNTNFRGCLRMIRAVLPAMRARKCGTIVNVSSVSAISPRPFAGIYSASKAAVEAISEALHFELQPYGIRIVLIEPGQFATRLHDNLVTAAKFTKDSPYRAISDRLDAAVVKLNPTGHRGNAQDVADAIVNSVRAQPPKLRHLVGQDAQLIATVRKQTDFEGYEKLMRETLGWQD